MPRRVLDTNILINFWGRKRGERRATEIDIDEASRVYWNGEWIPERAALEEKIKGAAAQGVQPEVHLRPNKLAKYDVVAGVMASAQRLGLTKIGIVGSEQFVE